MTLPSQPPGIEGDIPGLSPGRPVPVRRHPLGLPAGSVRALLTFMVLGVLWTLMLMPSEQIGPRIPIYLYYLMFIAVVHYYAAHGNSIAGPGLEEEASPLHLPRGTIRTLIFLGFAGVLGWRIYTGRDLHELMPIFPEDSSTVLSLLPLILIGAFLLGVFLARLANAMIAGPRGVPYWYQDILAWVALLGMLGLVAETIIQLVINPTLPDDRRLQLPQWQAFLSAIVGFYFGARS